MKKVRWVGFMTVTLAAVLGVIWLSTTEAERKAPTTHTIFMTAMELKGSTTNDKLAPPNVNPQDLSKGYGYKAPGEADKNDSKKWEVSSYIFNPAFVTVHKGDTVKLTVFVVNGDEHDVSIVDPNGTKVVPTTIWNRGREYQVSFVADKVGGYQLICSAHAPSMIANFLVLE